MDTLLKAWMPLSETAYYILLSLSEPRHGYGIIKYVESCTKGRITLGSGTVYTTLGKMKKAKLIHVLYDKERKTVYDLTPLGKSLVRMEIDRIKKVHADTLKEEVKHHDKT